MEVDKLSFNEGLAAKLQNLTQQGSKIIAALIHGNHVFDVQTLKPPKTVFDLTNGFKSTLRALEVYDSDGDRCLGPEDCKQDIYYIRRLPTETGGSDPRIDGLEKRMAEIDLRTQERRRHYHTPTATGTYTAVYDRYVEDGRISILSPRSYAVPAAPPGFRIPPSLRQAQRFGSEEAHYTPKLMAAFEEFGATRRVIDRGYKKVGLKALDFPTLTMVDTQKLCFLDRLAPDLSVMERGTGVNRMDVALITFIEMQTSGLDKEHKGKMIVYCEKMLEAQQWESYAQGYLTDTGDLELWTCERDPRGGFLFKVKTNMSLQHKDTCYHFLQSFMGTPQTFGHISFDMKLSGTEILRPTALLGSTPRSTVYAADLSTSEPMCDVEVRPCVWKVTECITEAGKAAARREMHALETTQGVNGLPRLVKCHYGKMESISLVAHIITEDRFCVMTHLEIDLVRGHIATLRGMHEKEIIHMDLEGKHIGFIISADGTKVSHIIDMSSALPANEPVQCQLVSGTRKCAAAPVMDVITADGELIPQSSHDLEAYVKAIMLIQNDSLAKRLNAASSFSSVRSVWTNCEASKSLWSTALHKARTPLEDGGADYDGVIEILEQLILE